MDEVTMLVQYAISVAIGIAYSVSGWTYSPLDAGWDTLAKALNETIVQWFPAAKQGFADNYVAGMAPTITLTGKRVLGDPAWDYIFSKQYETGASRRSSLRLSVTNLVTGEVETLTVPITIANIIDFGGGTNEGGSVSVELRMNAKPTLSTALDALKVVCVAGATSGKTRAYINPALTAGNSYVRRVFAAGAEVEMPNAGDVLSSPTWAAWNGSDDITAATGATLAIVEVDADSKAVKGGTATATAL